MSELGTTGVLPSTTPPAPRDRMWSERSKDLYDALLRRVPRMAPLYFAAIEALERLTRPEALHLVAHELREMMGHLPEYLELPRGLRTGKLGDQVTELVKDWDAAVKLTGCRIDGVWVGEQSGG